MRCKDGLSPSLAPAARPRAFSTSHHTTPHRSAPRPHHSTPAPLHISRYTRFLQEFSATLAGYLPGLWATAGASPEYGMLRTSIVRSYVKLVEALGSKNEEFYEFLCTVILHSIDTTQPQHEYLLEDGMELWHRTVQFAPVPTASLFELFGYVTHLMDREDGNGESTKTCVSLRYMRSHQSSHALCFKGPARIYSLTQRLALPSDCVGLPSDCVGLRIAVGLPSDCRRIAVGAQLLIVESYIILGGAFVLENYGKGVVNRACT